MGLGGALVMVALDVRSGKREDEKNTGGIGGIGGKEEVPSPV